MQKGTTFYLPLQLHHAEQLDEPLTQAVSPLESQFPMLPSTTFLKLEQKRNVARGGDVVASTASRAVSQPYHGDGYAVRFKFP